MRNQLERTDRREGLREGGRGQDVVAPRSVLGSWRRLFHRCLGRDADDQNLIAKLVAKLLESEPAGCKMSPESPMALTC